MELEKRNKLGIWAFDHMPLADVKARFINFGEHTTLKDTLWTYMDELNPRQPGSTDHIVSLAENLDEPIGQKSPRTVVAIPVAGHQEANNIDRALSQYGKQLLNKNLWEIILYVNSPEKDKNGNMLSHDETFEAIRDAQEKYDLWNLRVLQHQYSEPVSIGKVRKDLWDVIVYDQLSSPGQDRVLIINNDIDLINIKSDYLTEMTFSHALEGHNMLRAPLRFEANLLTPTANKLIKYYWQVYAASLAKSGWGNVATEANSAMDLELYCLYGGFDPTASTNEYNELVQRSNALKKGKINIHRSKAWLENAYLRTSSRRQLASIAIGNGLDRAWDTSKLPFTPFDSLRDRPPHEAAEKMAKEHMQFFIRNIEHNFIYEAALPEGVEEKLLKYAQAAKKILGLPIHMEPYEPDMDVEEVA